MSRLHALSICSTFLITGLFLPEAQGQTFFTDRTAWLAAVHNVSTDAFEGIAPPGGEIFDNFNSGSIGFSSFSSVTADIVAVSGTLASGHFSLNGSDDIVSETTGAGQETIAGSSISTNAMGTDIGFRSLSGPTTNSLTVQLYSGNNAIGNVFNAGSLSTGFIGVIYNAPFSEIRFFPGNSPADLAFDNFSTATSNVSSTPEPGTVAFMTGLGISGGLFLRRRKK